MVEKTKELYNPFFKSTFLPPVPNPRSTLSKPQFLPPPPPPPPHTL